MTLANSCLLLRTHTGTTALTRLNFAVSEEPDPGLPHCTANQERLLSTDCVAALTSSLAPQAATQPSLTWFSLTRRPWQHCAVILPPHLGCTKKHLIDGTANSDSCSVRNNQLMQNWLRHEGRWTLSSRHNPDSNCLSLHTRPGTTA